MAETIAFSCEDRALKGTLFEACNSRQVAVVLCHGAFESKDNWFHYAEHLAKQGFTTLVFDFTGHGESEGLRGMVDMHVWPYDIREALNFLGRRGYSSFGLVGWGAGGSAVVLAAVHDPRVRCAVALSPLVFLMPSLADRVAFILATGFSKIKKAIWKKPLTFSRVKELDEMRVALDDEANSRYLSNPQLQHHFEAVPVPESLHSAWLDITRAARNVRVPTLIIHGAEDTVNPVKQSQRLYDAVQGHKKLHIIDETGHAVHLDQHQDKVFELISSWMKRYLK
jgi:alpha-beta hydrolase superfamily lysophospholipase